MFASPATVIYIIHNLKDVIFSKKAKKKEVNRKEQDLVITHGSS